ncbi:MAG TPA: hypothetical protein DCZ72_10080 [Armatimonadetes bacterium]|nr:hypothetical protein [Armatimonadota bacterium]
MRSGQWVAFSAGLLTWLVAAGYASLLFARLRRARSATAQANEPVPTVVVRDVPSTDIDKES